LQAVGQWWPNLRLININLLYTIFDVLLLIILSCFTDYLTSFIFIWLGSTLGPSNLFSHWCFIASNVEINFITFHFCALSFSRTVSLPSSYRTSIWSLMISINNLQPTTHETRKVFDCLRYLPRLFWIKAQIQFV